MLLGLLFSPLSFYPAFAYGTILSLSFSLAAFRHFYLFERERSPRSLLRTLLAILLAVLLKSNALIFLLGLICATGLSCLHKFHLHRLLAVLLLFLVLIVQAPLGRVGIRLWGASPSRSGVHPLAFIYMGMCEGSSEYPGWYDASTVRSYQEAGNDSALQKKAVQKALKERLRTFYDNPGYAVNFYIAKNASQWNEPAFNAQFVILSRPADGEHRMSALFTRLFSTGGASLLHAYLNRLQFLILFGAFLSVFRKERDFSHLCYRITFLGGYIFHTFWEAKGQYTFAYFVLLLPMAVSGYGSLLAAWEQAAAGKERVPVLKQKPACIILTFGMLLLLLLTASGRITLLNRLFRRDEDTAAYAVYERQHAYTILETGDYVIANSADVSDRYRVRIEAKGFEMLHVITPSDARKDNPWAMKEIHITAAEQDHFYILTDWRGRILQLSDDHKADGGLPLNESRSYWFMEKID